MNRAQQHVLIVAHGFRKENVPLQPWRYLYELAARLAVDAKVTVLTGGAQGLGKETIGGIEVVSTTNLRVFRQRALNEEIARIAPTEVLWSITPMSVLLYAAIKRVAACKVGVITAPLYRFREVVFAIRQGVPFVEYRSLFFQSLIPKSLFRAFIPAVGIDRVIVQSRANRDALGVTSSKKYSLHVVRVGLDAESKLAPNSGRLVPSGETFTLLYMGSLKPIRGFNLILDAIRRIQASGVPVRLKVLARGATKDECEELVMSKLSLSENVQIECYPGWLDKAELQSQLQNTDLVLLPFILVPSDVPITILESMALGKVVVSTRVDGIPELLHERGVVLERSTPDVLASEILRLREDPELLARLGAQAGDFIETYPGWDEVGIEAKQIICRPGST